MNGSWEMECRCCSSKIRADYHGVSGIETRSCSACGYNLEWSEDGYIIEEIIPERYQSSIPPITFAC